MIDTLTNTWRDILAPHLKQPYYQQLQQFLQQQYNEETIFPKKTDVLNALQLTDFPDVKVVILGQDPYHGVNQAHGLSFSVKNGQKLPPSLKNMFKELQDDIGCPIPQNGDLTAWAKQGVLLLNTVLTVREKEAHAHKGQGWEQFTDAIIESIADRDEPAVFLLWGKPAQNKRILIKRFHKNHIILEAPHPSPLSAYRGFFGSKPYSKTNEALIAMGKQPIQWCISD
ncbi:uracil-DNA glycosylase [Solibacillus sp. FSL K6-1523]|uniref:uracil-DNA glycosylase n=1 Tax=Solibacillus sp. FSL K6-1523 TaxID=2921471 RepID=UPI0030F60AA3